MDESTQTTITVGDVMTKDVVALDINDTLDVIAGLFEKYDFDAIPVIDSEHVLKGIISKHDMILQSSNMHLPTMMKLIEQITHSKGDQRVLDQHFNKLRDIKAINMMDVNVMSLRSDSTLQEATSIFADYSRISTLSVVDEQKKLLGIISHSDVIKFFDQVYVRRVMEKKLGADSHLFKEYPSRSESEVEKAYAEVQDQFLLVQKSRPLLWKYVSIGMFTAGLLAATALIIRFVAKGG